jgi:hypothetical protein
MPEYEIAVPEPKGYSFRGRLPRNRTVRRTYTPGESSTAAEKSTASESAKNAKKRKTSPAKAKASSDKKSSTGSTRYSLRGKVKNSKSFESPTDDWFQDNNR